MAYDINGNWVNDGANQFPGLGRTSQTSAVNQLGQSPVGGMNGIYRTPGSLTPGALRYMSGAEQEAYFKGLDIENAAKDSGFGMNMNTIGTGFNIASGLGSLYLGNKQLGLAEDKFAYDKDMMNKQYAMAKDAYDKQVARAGSIGSQMNAGKVG